MATRPPRRDSLPPCSVRNQQKSRDRPKVNQLFHSLLSDCSDEASRARLLAACSNQSCAWLNAPPISSLGLRMPNDTVRIAIGFRVRLKFANHTHVRSVEWKWISSVTMACPATSQARVALLATTLSITSFTAPWPQPRCLPTWNQPGYTVLTETTRTVSP